MMNNPLYQILIKRFGNEANIARAFELQRVVHFKEKVPEHIALLCHLDPSIPYTYDPKDYGRKSEILSLNLSKPRFSECSNKAAA
ncbi:hypothetical protein ACPFUU_001588 [Vibrio cholerae]|uniref:hypothetical protein n=2 Tax=Vibrio TaxID=662 RepID=UPI0000EF9A5D|nr:MULTISPECIES: hypothetical protein [Vibrio]EGR2105422.1 hypothetical protein [Vibrio cholerae]EJK2192942.1 hypothetical protein [Vibrio cholerae]EJL6757169.1 hypothetical protein [Vibrio cholerae]EJY0882939.1 hypothetical protein [Vibrio cholerae]EKF9829436.1 hypothetical protein [Vibrio cholerae]